MLHNLVFTVPISRMVVRRYSLSTTAAAISTAVPSLKPASSKPARAPHVDSQVLLGMSEPELQQLAIKLGQVKIQFFTKLQELGKKKKVLTLG